jgi:CheY-like chemotaxis protein
VLVIDDEAAARKVVTRVLELIGLDYEVQTATSGLEGIERMKQDHFDLILLDFMMPDLDGLQTIPLMKELQPDVPILLFTAIKDQNVHQDAVRRGAAGVVMKPFDIDDLLTVVRETIGHTEEGTPSD